MQKNTKFEIYGISLHTGNKTINGGIVFETIVGPFTSQIVQLKNSDDTNKAYEIFIGCGLIYNMMIPHIYILFVTMMIFIKPLVLSVQK
jgi:hypothetical protein